MDLLAKPMGLVSKIEGIIGRAKLWTWAASSLVVVSGAFVWLVQQVAPIAAYGLAAVVLIGIALGCLLLLALGSIGIAWSAIFRPQWITSNPGQPSKQHYLKDAHFFGGAVSPPMNPRFEAKFIRSGQRCRLFIEHSYFPRAMGRVDWTSLPLIELPKVEEFVPGQTLNVVLLSPFETDGRKLWRWGPPTEQADPKNTFIESAWHRGRLIVRCDDAPPQNFYFIVDPRPDADVPALIGQNRFNFAQEWEARDEQ